MPSYVRAGIRKCARIRALSKATLDEAVTDVNNWIDQQAAKAE